MNIHYLNTSERELIERLRDNYGVLIPKPLEYLVILLKGSYVKFEYRQHVQVLEKQREANLFEWNEVDLEPRNDRSIDRTQSKHQKVDDAHFVIGEKVATIQFFENLEAANNYVSILRKAEQSAKSVINEWRQEVKESRLRIERLKVEIDELNKQRMEVLGGRPTDLIFFGQMENDVQIKILQLNEYEKIASSPRPTGLDKYNKVALENAAGTILNLNDLLKLVSAKRHELFNIYEGMLPQYTDTHLMGPIYAVIGWRNHF